MFIWLFVIICSNIIAAVVPHPYERSSVHTCIWHNNECVTTCPDWMVLKRSKCSDTSWFAQRTCDHPEQRLVSTLCGFARCDCPDPMVLDTDTGFCYDLDNCPPNHVE